MLPLSVMNFCYSAGVLWGTNIDEAEFAVPDLMSFGSGGEVKLVASVNQRGPSGQGAKWKVNLPFKLVALSSVERAGRVQNF